MVEGRRYLNSLDLNCRSCANYERGEGLDRRRRGTSPEKELNKIAGCGIKE